MALLIPRFRAANILSNENIGELLRVEYTEVPYKYNITIPAFLQGRIIILNS